MKRRLLLQALILSGALNVVLIAIFFYFLIYENPLQFAFQPKPEVKQSERINASFLKQLEAYYFEQLVDLLDDERKVQHGYKVRDFALTALVTFHDFDLFRALGVKELSKQLICLDEINFTLYPGLRDIDFVTLREFAKLNRFPYTTKGLLKRLETYEKDPEFLIYFYHAPEFILLESLFARSGLPISKNTILAIVKEGGWERFSHFYEKQQEKCDLSKEARQQLLLDYISAGSKTAAYLLLVTDPEFAYLELEDTHIALMLQLLDVKTKEALDFAQKLVSSPRSDLVRRAAFKRLTEYSGDEIAREVPRPSSGQLRPLFRDRPPDAPSPSVHIIQPGESLWLISRKYNVSIEDLMRINHLHSTLIQPGKTLSIP